MDFCAKTSVFLGTISLLSSAELGAQVMGVAPELSWRISQEIGAMWRVPAERIELEWGIVVQPSSMTANATFELRGSGRDGWFGVLILRTGKPPFAVRVRAGVRDTVAVATRGLSPGRVLEHEDLGLAELVRWGAPSALRSLPLAGWSVRRAVRSGDMLDQTNVQPPLLVQAGDVVRLLWHRGNVKVAIEAVALNRASLGEEVRVRLRDRRGRVKGVATAPGTVQMLGGGER